MTDLKDWIEKLRDQKTATCLADYEERCELAHALSALEKERDEALAANSRLARLGRAIEAERDRYVELAVEAEARAQAAETELSALKALVGRMVEGLEQIAEQATEFEVARAARSLLSEAKGEGER